MIRTVVPCFAWQNLRVSVSRCKVGRDSYTSSGTPVASVEPTRAVAMFRPCSPTQPAELMPALAACHVHAALVLLYGPLALGAGFRIRDDPCEILTFSTVFYVPLLNSFAVHRPVCLLLACEAECSATLAHHVQRSARNANSPIHSHTSGMGKTMLQLRL